MSNDILFTSFINKIDADIVQDNIEDYLLSGFHNVSDLKKFLIAPAKYLSGKDEVQKETESSKFGTAYHCYLLESDKFDNNYFISDEVKKYNELLERYKSPRSTTEYKDWMYQQNSEANGRIVLFLEDYEQLKTMKQRIMSNQYLLRILNSKNKIIENSFYCTITLTSGQLIKCKIRPDYLNTKSGIIIDLKTCQSAYKNDFIRTAGDYGYHISAALYTIILNSIFQKEFKFLFLAQEKTSPYLYNIFEVPYNVLSMSVNIVEQMMLLAYECKNRCEYPGYQVWCNNQYGIESLDISPYFFNDVNFYFYDK